MEQGLSLRSCTTSLEGEQTEVLMLEPTYHRSEPPSIRDIRVSNALCDRRAYVEAHRRAKEQAGGNLDMVIQLLLRKL